MDPVECAAIIANLVSIFCVLFAPTGYGKTTIIPPELVAKEGRILVCLPTNNSVFSAYKRLVAKKKSVGYIMGKKSKDVKAKIVFIVVGRFVKKTLYNSNYLKSFSYIMIDEVHEKSGDYLCSFFLLKQVYKSFVDKGDKFPKIIVSTATPDSGTMSMIDLLSDVCGEPKILKPEREKVFDVNVRYKDVRDDFGMTMDLRTNIASTFKEIKEHVLGDISQIRREDLSSKTYGYLILLPGINDIRRFLSMFHCNNKDVVYHVLAGAEGTTVNFTKGKINIIVGTPQAGCSITPPVHQVHIVPIKKRLFLDETGELILKPVYISQQELNQMLGRVGRFQSGEGYVYIPEIIKDNLPQVTPYETEYSCPFYHCLVMKKLGVCDEEIFRHFGGEKRLNRINSTLIDLGALTKSGDELTHFGNDILSFPWGWRDVWTVHTLKIKGEKSFEKEVYDNVFPCFGYDKDEHPFETTYPNNNEEILWALVVTSTFFGCLTQNNVFTGPKKVPFNEMIDEINRVIEPFRGEHDLMFSINLYNTIIKDSLHTKPKDLDIFCKKHCLTLATVKDFLETVDNVTRRLKIGEKLKVIDVDDYLVRTLARLFIETNYDNVMYCNATGDIDVDIVVSLRDQNKRTYIPNIFRLSKNVESGIYTVAGKRGYFPTTGGQVHTVTYMVPFFRTKEQMTLDWWIKEFDMIPVDEALKNKHCLFDIICERIPSVPNFFRNSGSLWDQLTADPLSPNDIRDLKNTLIEEMFEDTDGNFKGHKLGDFLKRCMMGENKAKKEIMKRLKGKNVFCQVCKRVETDKTMIAILNCQCKVPCIAHPECVDKENCKKATEYSLKIIESYENFCVPTDPYPSEERIKEAWDEAKEFLNEEFEMVVEGDIESLKNSTKDVPIEKLYSLSPEHCKDMVSGYKEHIEKFYAQLEDKCPNDTSFFGFKACREYGPDLKKEETEEELGSHIIQVSHEELDISEEDIKNIEKKREEERIKSLKVKKERELEERRRQRERDREKKRLEQLYKKEKDIKRTQKKNKRK